MGKDKEPKIEHPSRQEDSKVDTPEQSKEAQEMAKELSKYKYVEEDYLKEKHDLEIAGRINHIYNKADRSEYLKALGMNYVYGNEFQGMGKEGYKDVGQHIWDAASKMREELEKEIEDLINKFPKKNIFLVVLTSRERGSGDYTEKKTPVKNIEEAIKVTQERPSNHAGNDDPAYLLIVKGSEGEGRKIVELPMTIWVG